MPSSPNDANVLYAINGFLGRPADWSSIKNFPPAGWRLETIDLWSEGDLANYDDWAQKVGRRLAAKMAQATTANGAGKKILLGYSLGGRLALHLLLAAPKFFDGAIIVSANPGLVSGDERTLRRRADDIWAAKFLTQPWPALMAEWDAQAALRPPPKPASDAVVLERPESDFDRTLLAQALRTWSLGAQRDLRHDLTTLTLPIEFVTGQTDIKFTAIAQDLVKLPARSKRELVVVPNAGHRVPWDAPSQFSAVVANFLARW